jgi:hypothetical protein
VGVSAPPHASCPAREVGWMGRWFLVLVSASRASSAHVPITGRQASALLVLSCALLLPVPPLQRRRTPTPVPPPPLFFSTTPCLKAVTPTQIVFLSPPSPLHLHAECERLVARHLDEVGLGELRALSRPACGRSPTSRALRTRPSPPPRPPSSRPTPPRARAASSITPSPSRARTAPRLRRGPRAGSSGRRPSRRRRGARRRSGGAPRAALLPRGRENGVG